MRTLFILAALLAALAWADNCTAYLAPMTSDGTLGWEDKMALMDTAVGLYCLTPSAPAAACEKYTEMRKDMFTTNWQDEQTTRHALIGRWRVLSFNDSLCTDPWVPNLTRASTILAPRFLQLLPHLKVRYERNDRQLSWHEKWGRFRTLVKMICPTKNDLCGTLIRKEMNFDTAQELLAAWANIARLHDWSFDPWDIMSKKTQGYLGEFAVHPVVDQVLWECNRKWSSYC